MNDDAYENGYFNGETRENPYEVDSEAYKEYERGKSVARSDLKSVYDGPMGIFTDMYE